MNQRGRKWVGRGLDLKNLGPSRHGIREPLTDPGPKAVLSILAFPMSHSVEQRVHLRTLRLRRRQAPKFLAPTRLHFPAPPCIEVGSCDWFWPMGCGPWASVMGPLPGSAPKSSGEKL